MGSFSLWHWLIVLAVAMLLFGSGKVSALMGDFGRGLRSFRRELAEEGESDEMPSPVVQTKPIKLTGT